MFLCGSPAFFLHLYGHPLVVAIGIWWLCVGIPHSGSGLIAQVGGLSVGICCIPAFLGVIPDAEKSIVLSIGVEQGGGVHGGCNAGCWPARHVLRSLWRIVCRMWRGITVAKFQLV